MSYHPNPAIECYLDLQSKLKEGRYFSAGIEAFYFISLVATMVALLVVALPFLPFIGLVMGVAEIHRRYKLSE